MTFRIGVLVPSREAFLRRDYDPAALLRFGERAEELGFDSVWVGDSPLARPRFDPLTLLAALAARTARIELGTAILLPVLRHPLLLAHSLATLDRIAAGRLVLGIGAGAAIPSTEAELAAVGVPFAERLSRLRETVRLWRALWAPARDGGPKPGFAGRHWTLDATELLPTPTRGTVRIWWGGGGDRMLRFAAEELDGWFPTAPTAERFAAGLSALEAARTRAGREESALERAVYLTVTADRDPARAAATQRAFAEGYYGAPFDVLAAVQGFHADTLEGCVAHLRRFIDAGARHLVLRFGTLDATPQLERFGRDALPLLR